MFDLAISESLGENEFLFDRTPGDQDCVMEDVGL